jgi:tetratricopeptide (TPR) repeat protein
MVASSERKLRIFISHSHHDNQFGIRLYEDLNNIIRRSHDTVWYDKRESKLGDHWRKVIDQQLERCNVFILLFSRAAKRSGWVDYELDAAIARTVSRKGKIFVICCDDSPLPKNLQIRYQLITCTSPEEYKPTINKIARDLGLDTEPEDLKEATIQQWTRQLQLAFDNKDWIDVNRRADFFIERFPDASLFSIYRMKSFALLELEQAKQSLDALDKASSCTKDREHHLKLLEEYTVLLIDKEYWHGVRMASDRALKLLPDDIKWLTRQEQAYMRLGLKKQVILPSMNGHTTTVEFSEVEEDTSIDAPVADTLTQTSTSAFTDSDNNIITSGLQTTQSRSTTSLLDNFTQQIVPHRYLKQMFQNKLSLSMPYRKLCNGT